MRIAINAVAVDGGGSQEYLLRVLEALSGAVGFQHRFLVIQSDRQHELRKCFPPGVHAVVCQGIPRGAGMRMLWEQIVLPLILRRMKPDLLYAAFNTAVLLSRVPTVLASHNSTPFGNLRQPLSVYGRARNLILRLLGTASARVARKVVFVSRTSARIMAPAMGIPESRVAIVHHGWSPLPESRDPALPTTIPAPYILTVADLYPHKNLEVLLVAFGRLAASNAYSGHLVIVGGVKSWCAEYPVRLRKLRDQLPCRDRIHFVGAMPHDRLSSIYRRADLFVFPSVMETFGLPLLEAMGCGVPVVANDWRIASGERTEQFNVGPEVCGGAAEFFDPTDPLSLRDAMLRVLKNPAHREELVRRGLERVKLFSWEEGARQLLALFEEVVPSGRVGRSRLDRPARGPVAGSRGV